MGETVELCPTPINSRRILRFWNQNLLSLRLTGVSNGLAKRKIGQYQILKYLLRDF